MAFYVYILSSRRNGTLYIGMTDNLIQRVWMHRNGILPGFTKQYGVKMLVWYEQHETREAALTRERQMKKWNREWKLQIIEQSNPRWSDLYESLSV
jgi:putative endonuclease